MDIFSSHVGYVLSTITLATGLIVFRYAPGGDGPMDFYMVVSSSNALLSCIISIFVCYFDIRVFKRSIMFWISKSNPP